MGNLFLDNRLFPTDLLFRNFFAVDSDFQSHVDSKPDYPVDVATTDAGLVIEIAAVGIDKEDINSLTIFTEALLEELLTLVGRSRLNVISQKFQQQWIKVCCLSLFHLQKRQHLNQL